MNAPPELVIDTSASACGERGAGARCAEAPLVTETTKGERDSDLPCRQASRHGGPPGEFEATIGTGSMQ